MNFLKVLGASGSKYKNKGTTCFQISSSVLIDAGNVINTLGNKTLDIEHIFLTHSHSDHIADIPFLLDGFYEDRKKPLNIYGSKETIKTLKNHLFNEEIWPDFQKIKLYNKDLASLNLIEINTNDEYTFSNHTIKPFNSNHVKGSFGFKVSRKNSKSYVISGDTYISEELTKVINEDDNIAGLVIDCSFPNKLEKIGKLSNHLSSNILKKQISTLKNKSLKIFVYHVKHSYLEEIQNELDEIGVFSNGGKILEDGDIIQFDLDIIEKELLDHIKFERLININLELSSELNKNKLFEMIIELAMDLTFCEGGTLYTISEDKKYLDFQVIQNKKLNIFMGGTKDQIEWSSIPLYTEDNKQNKTMVAAACALDNKIINIDDVYKTNLYDFDGPKNFDRVSGYKTQSIIVIPLINHENDVIGVLQLLNKNTNSKNIISFDHNDEEILKALASQAAMALTNSQLINSIEKFLEAIVKTIAKAIDAKSKHTSHHIVKVAKIAEYIAKAIHNDNSLYKNVMYTQNDFEQIRLAALLHDIGKISMPERVIDKGKKLEKIVDRIEIVKHRFEILKRDLEIAFLKNEINKKEFEIKNEKLNEDLDFLRTANVGGEFMKDEDISRIEEIAQNTYILNHTEEKILSEEEVYNLSIRKGTLTKEEKDIMNSHADLSLEMLSELPFPKKYKDVMHIAVNHHEKLNGKGYPRGLSADEITLEDRIMILADVFEALTSNERPYKDAKKLSEVFKILSFMAKDGEIDKNLLRFFHESDELKEFAKEELFDYQRDESKLLF